MSREEVFKKISKQTQKVVCRVGEKSKNTSGRIVFRKNSKYKKDISKLTDLYVTRTHMYVVDRV